MTISLQAASAIRVTVRGTPYLPAPSQAAAITAGVIANAYLGVWTQLGVGAVTRTIDSKLKEAVSVTDFGAVGNGIADETAAFAAMITFLNSRSNGVSGGGLGHVPQGRYRINGVLPYLGTNVGLFGDGPQATLLDFQNGSNDCFLMGVAGTPTRGQTLSGMYLGAQGKTGGTMVKFRNTFNAMLSRIQSEANWTGLDVGPRCNGTIMEDIFCTATQGAAPVCLKFVAGASNADRSDVLVLRNVILSGQWSDATCIEWDGAAYTIDAHTLRMLHAKYGMVVKNTAANASWYPSFLNAHNIQAEGFKERALWVQAGAGFKITGSDINNLTAGDPSQGSADLSAILFEPDTGVSFTRSIEISDTRIGGSQREGVIFNCRDVQMANVVFYSTSFSGSGNYPVIRCGSAAQDIQLSNIRAEEFGGSARASYLVALDAGATRVQGNNLDCTYCVTGDVQDNSGNATNVFTNIISRTGLPTQSHNGQWWHRFALPNAYVKTQTHNLDATGTSQAGFTASTALANTFRQFLVHNNNGVPYSIINGGSAVTTHYQDEDTTIWRTNAGAEKGRLDSAGMKLSATAKYFINNLQVVGPRKTGWAVATGTATRTTFDTTTVTTAQLAERLKALIDDLHGTAGHGLIGT